MTTPAQGNVILPGALYACDNGKFGEGWPGTIAWFAWLKATVDRYGRDRCLWAVAPTSPWTPRPPSPSRFRGWSGSAPWVSRSP
jgi:hypothetical protein